MHIRLAADVTALETYECVCACGGVVGGVVVVVVVVVVVGGGWGGGGGGGYRSIRFACQQFSLSITLQWRHYERDGVSITGVSIVSSTACSGAN